MFFRQIFDLSFLSLKLIFFVTIFTALEQVEFALLQISNSCFELGKFFLFLRDFEVCLRYFSRSQNCFQVLLLCLRLNFCMLILNGHLITQFFLHLLNHSDHGSAVKTHASHNFSIHLEVVQFLGLSDELLACFDCGVIYFALFWKERGGRLVSLGC